ncbi:MAG TPA: AIM24 family protein [Acidimicrobiales bacterium]|nr:AIM24 family protein [Acidimicrobiales bacterium]
MTGTATASASTYTCPYCRQASSGAGTSCPNCGAPVDIQLRTTASGWTELPSIADMAKIQFGQSSCQVEGRLVPVAEMDLAAGDGVYFTHDVLLWQQPGVQLDAPVLSKPWNRKRNGLPLVMMQATGPGRVAFSHDAAGELVALPLQPGAAVDVREGALLVATSGVGYDWVDSGVWFVAPEGGHQEAASPGGSLLRAGLEMAGRGGGGLDRGRDNQQPTWHYPVGQYLDRFHAGDRPGLVMVQVSGNAYVRDIAAGESLLVKPPALLFKEPSVGIQLHVEYPAAGVKIWQTWNNRYLWLRVWGPGRIGLQSCYDRLEDPGTDFRDLSPHTDHLWT